MTLAPRWFRVIGLAAVLVAVGGLIPVVGWIGAVLALCSTVLAIVEAVKLPATEDFAVQRDLPPCMASGASYGVTVAVRSLRRDPVHLLIHEEPPRAMDNDWADAVLNLVPGGVGALTYSVSPRRRGDHSFGDVWIRVGTRIGLVQRILRYPVTGWVRVMPAAVAPGKLPIASYRARERGTGMRAQRWTGAGRQFESLRDYAPDDDFRSVDWKATARRGKLTTREYQMERSQVILLALDLGRTMVGSAAGAVKTDHAINAALSLAQVSAACDDHVGLLTFDAAVRQWLPPRKGRAQLRRLVGALYAADAAKVEADYRGAADHVLRQCRSRSLVVVFTDVWEAGASARLSEELRRIARRHLVLCVGLSDGEVMRQARADPSDRDAVYRQAVALQMLHDRGEAIRHLQARGITVVDSTAERISADLVSRYLEVKRRALL